MTSILHQLQSNRQALHVDICHAHAIMLHCHTFCP